MVRSLIVKSCAVNQTKSLDLKYLMNDILLFFFNFKFREMLMKIKSTLHGGNKCIKIIKVYRGRKTLD